MQFGSDASPKIGAKRARLKDPKAKIPHTIMMFAGIKDEADAKNLWVYLKQFDAEGKKK